MNADSRNAIALLVGLDDSRARLHESTTQMLARHRQLLKSANAYVGFGARSGGANGMVEVTAHADPLEGPCVWWTLVLSWDQTRWFVDADVSIDSDSNYGGVDCLIDFPQRTTEKLDECLIHVSAATDDLIHSGDVWEILNLAGNQVSFRREGENDA